MPTSVSAATGRSTCGRRRRLQPTSWFVSAASSEPSSTSSPAPAAERDRGTREVAPVYDGSTVVRFTGDAEDWTWPSAAWSGTRVGYLQHANDPITWWSWVLAVQRPDWLEEPRGEGVSPDIRWIPLVSMLQLGADQLMASHVPVGQVHLFGTEPAKAWAAILPPPGWSAGDTERLASLDLDAAE